MTTANKDHFIGLDGLRGVAALMIMMLHINGRMPTPSHWLQHCDLAVDLFFILSGFVVARDYEVRLKNGMPFFSYLRIRLIRLYPLMALGIAAGLIAYICGAPLKGATSVSVFAALLFIPAVWTTQSVFPLNNVQWSLFFELLANVAHALSVKRLSNRLLCAVIAVFAVALVVAARSYGGLGVGWTMTNFWGGFARVGFSFPLGVLLYRLWKSDKISKPILPVILPLIAVGAVCISAGDYRLTWRWYVDLPIVMLAFPTIVWVAAGARPGPKMTALLSALGALSYPVYALQLPIIFVIEIASRPLGLISWQIVIAETLTCLALSWIAYSRYDVPIRNFLLRRSRGPSMTNHTQQLPTG